MKKARKLVILVLGCMMLFGATLSVSAAQARTMYVYCTYCKAHTPHDYCNYCGDYCRPCGRNSYGVNHWKNH